MSALEGQKGGKSSIEYKTLSSEYSQLSQTIKSLESDIRSIDKELGNNKVEMAGLTTQIDSSNEAYKKMQDQLTNLKNTQITPKGLVELRTEIAKLTGLNISEVPTDLEELQRVINGLTEKELDDIANSLAQIKTNSDSLPGSLAPAKESVKGLGEAGREVTRTANEIENLKNQVLQFFSLTNSVQLFRRAVTSALNTVKELDATMTEAAVVTEFDVGDMWEKLPQYSKEAQNLGVSINGMYQATTLYYQQGLKNQEAMELGIETMKMGKIAAMDSTEATKAMTAALRGFNMELNQTSATRVNDVYSQLAAVTAADTNQIATAMEKTASIAASANMEFETTAALLAQIIETTQEAPETAGTAMKTIIARFAEVKSLREQGLTSGQDEEGEVIDVNKIQTALRTVGISMEGFFSGTEGLDSILLKLSEKWGTLDFETQRYIATMAAGSRQQSRFIAMMSDYGRTTELVGQAQNSAGASQKQFEKTQESLATSIQRLENAWDQFLMGLANNEVLKFGIDTLTTILEAINKITDALSGDNGLTKSLVSLIGVVGALKGGRALLNSQGVNGLLGGLTGQGSWTETRTQSTNEKGEIVETVVKNPIKQGEKAGTQAGNGFVSGFTKAVKANKAGEKGVGVFMKNVFTNQVTDYKKLEEGLLSFEATDDSSLGKIQQELRDGKISAEQASEKFKALGVDINDVNKNSQATIPNFQAMGTAIMSAGAAVSLLANLFESLGMEEEAKESRTLATALTMTGVAFSVLGPIVKTVSNVLITKGVQVQAAWWWVTLIVAAVAAVIAAIAFAIKKVNENSLEGRMQAAAEATEKAKQAAEGAKQAYDDLFSDKSKYEQLQEKLTKLTAGTDEWKKTLLESNSEVMKLLSNYSKLSKYIEIGDNGQLIIKPEGFKELEKDAENKVVQANTQVQVDTYQEQQLKLKKEEGNLDNALRDNYDSYDMETSRQQIQKQVRKILNASQESLFDLSYNKYNGKLTDEAMSAVLKDMPELTKENITELWNHKQKGEEMSYQGVELVELTTSEIAQKIKEAYQNNKNLFTDEEALQTLSYQIGLGVNDIKTFADEIANWEVAMNQVTTEMQSTIKAMLSGKLSPETLKKESANEAMAFTSKYFETEGKKGKYGTGALTADQIYSKNGNSDVDNENLYLKELGKAYGYDFNNEKNDKTNLQGLYKIMSGKTDDEIKDFSEKELAALIADLANADYAANQTEELIAKIEALAPDKQKIYGAALSGDLTGLNKTELDQLSTLKPEDIATYFGLNGEQKEKFMTDFSDNIANAIKVEQNKYKNVEERANSRDLKKNRDQFKKGSAAAFGKYVDLIEQSILIGGKDTIEQGFEKIFAAATDTQDQKIMSWLESADWTKNGTGEAFIALLKQMGLEIEKIIPGSQEFCNQLKKVNALYRNFDTADILNNVTNSLKEAEEIAGQNELTNDQYVKYLEKGLLNADEWQFNGKGWVNVTSGMSNLVEALKQNTIAVFESTKQEAQAQIDFYERIQKKLNEGKEQGSTDRRYWEYKNIVENANLSYDQHEFAYDYFGMSSEEATLWKNLKEGGYQRAKDFLSTAAKFNSNLITFKGLDDEKKKEDIEKYYNEYEKLTTIAKQRERLERYRNYLLEEGNAQLAKEKRKELRQSLVNERAIQMGLVEEKQVQIDTILAENKNILTKAGGLTMLPDGTIQLIRPEKVNALSNEDRESFNKILSRIEKTRDQKRDAQAAAIEMEIQIDGLDREDRDAYIELTNRIKEALIAERQKEIDKLSEINNSINDTNSKIINSMQRQIDEARQARDNEKTEQEIADKQARLAYLQQDSSGANALEILQLQKEIEESQESYTDQLIDQKISELQKQNNEAAEQRQQQIDIMNNQLKYDKDSADFYKTIKEKLASAYVDGNVDENSSLIKLLKTQENFDSMSDAEKQKWLEEVIAGIAAGYNYDLNSIKNYNHKAIETYSSGSGSVSTSSGTTSSGTGKTVSTSSGTGKIASISNTVASKMSNSEIKKLQSGLNDLINDGKIKAKKVTVDGKYNSETIEAVRVLQQKLGGLDLDGRWGPNTYNKFHASNLVAYKEGGLADFTGPAWLDGTKSKPEYILDADQTKAFFTLVDVLSGLQTKGAQTTQNTGDSTYDIDINVESIGNDYDVEQLASKIKSLINEDARYRNNNAISLMR